MRSLVLAIAFLLFGGDLLAHPGGLDSFGGHHDRKNGGYHYHRGGPSVSRPPIQLPSPRTTARNTGTTTPRTTPRLTASNPADTIVWVSHTDSSYHQPNCKLLGIPDQKTTLRDVIDRYFPCEKCRPPVSLRAIPASDSRYESARQIVVAHIHKLKQLDEEQRQREREASEKVAEKERQAKLEKMERSAQSKLRLAKQMLESDRLAGQRWLREVVKEFPGTLAATQAQHLLDQLDL